MLNRPSSKQIKLKKCVYFIIDLLLKRDGSVWVTYRFLKFGDKCDNSKYVYSTLRYDFCRNDMLFLWKSILNASVVCFPRFEDDSSCHTVTNPLVWHFMGWLRNTLEFLLNEWVGIKIAGFFERRHLLRLFRYFRSDNDIRGENEHFFSLSVYLLSIDKSLKGDLWNGK
jgi:hypothetical protein